MHTSRPRAARHARGGYIGFALTAHHPYNILPGRPAPMQSLDLPTGAFGRPARETEHAARASDSRRVAARQECDCGVNATDAQAETGSTLSLGIVIERGSSASFSSFSLMSFFSRQTCRTVLPVWCASLAISAALS